MKSGQVVTKFGRALVTVVGVLGHRGHDDRLEIGRHRRVDTRGHRRVLTDVLVSDGDRAVPCEWRPARNHFVQHDAEGVDVTSGIHGLALGLFRREVAGRAHDGPGLGEAFPGLAHRSGNAKIRYFDPAVVVDQHIAWLHVPVDHTPAVGKVQCTGHVSANGGGPGGGEGALPDAPRESLPVDVLHHDEVGVLALAPVVYRDDVGVRKIGCRLSFPPEPLDKGRVR